MSSKSCSGGWSRGARGPSKAGAWSCAPALTLVLLGAGTVRGDELRGAILTAGYGQPLGAHGSIAWFSGKVPYSELYPGPVFGITPELSAGSGGIKASLGVTGYAPLLGSLTLKGSLLRSRWNPVGVPENATYFGPELNLGVTSFARVSAGVLFRTEGPRSDAVFTWGVGPSLPVLKERDEDAAGWDREHAEAQRRAIALARREDGQARLAAVVLGDGSHQLKREALARLTDPERLWEVILRAPWTRWDALPRVCRGPVDVEALTDPARLLVVARESPGLPMRLQAGRRYRERVPAPAGDVAALLEYDVEQAKDENTLMDVARKHPSTETRRLALRKISDSDCLAALARDGDRWLKDEVASRVVLLEARARVDAAVDEAALGLLATHDPSELVRELAIDRLRDQTVLAQVAKNDPVPSLRGRAVGRLEDQVTLAQFAINDGDVDVARRAAGRLTDRRALLAVAATNREVGSIAVERVWTSKDPADVSRLSDQELLGAIARRHRTPGIAVAAVGRIADEAALAEVALNACREEATMAAVGRIDDPRLLGSVAKALAARRPVAGTAALAAALARLCPTDAAVAGVEDTDVLVTLAEHDPRTAVALAALARVDRPERLVEITLAARQEPVRRAALERITDRPHLAEVLASSFETPLWPMRDSMERRLETLPPGDPVETALAIRRIFGKGAPAARPALALLVATPEEATRLSDLGALLFVSRWAAGKTGEAAALRYCAVASRALLTEAAARGLDDSRLRQAALARLVRDGDQAALASLAVSVRDEWWRRTVVESLDDPAILAQIAGADEASMVRRAATMRVQDAALLAAIAGEDPSLDVRLAAVERVADPVVLAGLATGGRDAAVRQAAVRRVTDPALLARVVRTDPAEQVRASAVYRITDRGVLSEVALHDEAPEVREAASTRVNDPDLLRKLATTDPDARVRCSATQRLIDREVLKAIANNDKDEPVRLAASRRLKEVRSH